MKTGLITKNDSLLPSLWGRGATLDKWIDDFFSPTLFNSWNLDPYPTDEYWDKDGLLNIEVPLAGFKKEDISVYVENGYLVLHANKQDSKEDVKYVTKGIRKKELTRKWFLNDTFDSENIDPSFVDGILSIKIKPKEQEKTKKHLIEIK